MPVEAFIIIGPILILALIFSIIDLSESYKPTIKVDTFFIGLFVVTAFWLCISGFSKPYELKTEIVTVHHIDGIQIININNRIINLNK